MSRALINEYTVFFVILLFNFNVYTNDKIKVSETPAFSSDFEVFLKDLETILDKSKNRALAETTNLKQNKYDLSWGTTPKSAWNKRTFNSHKSALSDVLMMKLVSYYENKYKIANHEPKLNLTDTSLKENSNQYNILDVIDNVNKDGERSKYIGTTKIPSFVTFDFSNNPQTTDASYSPLNIEEVVNIMDYAPMHIQTVPDTVNNLHSKAQVGKLAKQNSPKYQKVLYAVNNRIPVKGKTTRTKQNKNIFDSTRSNKERETYHLNNRDNNNKRIQTVERTRISLESNSPEAGDMQNIFEDGYTVIREGSFVGEVSSNHETLRNIKDFTRSNVDRMRIIIGTSPIEKRTTNMRKNNDEYPISEVIVI